MAADVAEFHHGEGAAAHRGPSRQTLLGGAGLGGAAVAVGSVLLPVGRLVGVAGAQSGDAGVAAFAESVELAAVAAYIAAAQSGKVTTHGGARGRHHLRRAPPGARRRVRGPRPDRPPPSKANQKLRRHGGPAAPGRGRREGGPRDRLRARERRRRDVPLRPRRADVEGGPPAHGVDPPGRVAARHRARHRARQGAHRQDLPAVVPDAGRRSHARPVPDRRERTIDGTDPGHQPGRAAPRGRRDRHRAPPRHAEAAATPSLASSVATTSCQRRPRPCRARHGPPQCAEARRRGPAGRRRHGRLRFRQQQLVVGRGQHRRHHRLRPPRAPPRRRPRPAPAATSPSCGRPRRSRSWRSPPTRRPSTPAS